MTPPICKLVSTTRASRGALVRTIVACLALTWIAPAAAGAQTCAMLPPGQPPGGLPAPSQSQRAAIDVVMTALATAGIAVIASEDAQRRMIGEAFAECNDLECGGAVARSLGVDFVVLVTVWAPRGTPTSVVVTLVGAHDSAAGDSPVDSGNVAGAALRALVVARQRWQASQMGFLEIETTPAGAAVEIDGRVVGQTPIRHLVSAGERRVRLLLPGYETAEQTVQVQPTREHPLEITLHPEEEVVVAPPVVRRATTRVVADVWNIVLGGGFTAIGVGLLIYPMATLAQTDQCAEWADEAEMFCRRTYQFGPISGVLVGAAAASFVVAGVFLFGQPIQTTVVVSPDSARVGLRGSF